MKKIWKVLAIAAAAAAVIPYKVEENIETGERTWDALLWQFRSRPEGDGEARKELTILPNRLPRRKAEEADWFDEDEDLDLPTDRSYVVFPDGEVIVEADEPGPF